jgi:hypothetical protein
MCKESIPSWMRSDADFCNDSCRKVHWESNNNRKKEIWGEDTPLTYKAGFREGVSFARAVKQWKKHHNIIKCCGYFEKGKIIIKGLDTLQRTKVFDLVQTEDGTK